MEALSLKSQTEERKNVKELFETIGIPYEAAFGSPDMKGFMKTPPSKKTLFSDLTANKDQSRRNQASAMKCFEPETARRRRDSLDQVLLCLLMGYFSFAHTICQRIEQTDWFVLFSWLLEQRLC